MGRFSIIIAWGGKRRMSKEAKAWVSLNRNVGAQGSMETCGFVLLWCFFSSPSLVYKNMANMKFGRATRLVRSRYNWQSSREME